MPAGSGCLACFNYLADLAALIERLAAQVEDLAAVVDAIDSAAFEEEEQEQEDALVALLGAAYCLDESWGLAPIVGRKAQGIDCTQDESAIVLGAFDRLHAIGAPADASRDVLAELFPLEFDQWSREHDQGVRPGPARQGPTLTVGEFLKLFDGVSPDTPVTVQHNDWWLNVTGLYVPPVIDGRPEEPSVQIETVDDISIIASGDLRYP